MKMKILTWNINGIRSSKVPLKQLFDSLDADVICLQETKVTRDQLDERTAVVEGYNSFFSFSRVKSGYSGVATYIRETATPVKAEEGLTGLLSTGNFAHNIGCYGDHAAFTDEQLHSLDSEGRAILTQHRIMTEEGEEKLLTVINVYCPRADPEREDRKLFKLGFYQLLQTRAEALIAPDSHVIVLGDINTSHKRIDHCEPEECEDFEERPGRKWLSQFLWDPQDVSDSKAPHPCPPSGDSATKDDSFTKTDSTGIFVDTFRFFHPAQKNAFTCWSTATGARTLNYGTRIDYIFADKEMTKAGISDCVIMPDFQGSDHCPVKMIGHWAFIPSRKCPPSCTRFWPEFLGRQQKLSSFFVVGKKQTSPLVQNSTIADGTNLPCPKDPESESTQNKRQGSDSTEQPNKKPKLEKSNSIPKQSTLSSFFSNPKQIVAKSKTVIETCSSEKTILWDCSSDRISEPAQGNDRVKDTAQELKPKGTSADAWKSLLKGPSPAPLCKGHQEACVLRTVKKDSLNKGRQFYVCARPDGPKTNPEA